MELFQPDNLSAAEPRFDAEADPELLATLRRVLGTSYAHVLAAGDARVRSYAGANVTSRNFAIDSGSGSFFLKMKRDVTTLRREVELIARFAERGLPVPQLVPPAAAREHGTELPMIEHAGYGFALFVFASGRYFSGSLDELESAARAFTALSSEAMGWPAAQRERLAPPQDLSLSPELLRELVREGAASSEDPELAVLCRTHAAVVERELSCVSAADDARASQLVPMHLDFHPLNVLMHAGAVSCVVDFEGFRAAPCASGFGFACYKLVRQWLTLSGAASWPARRSEVLARFTRGVRAVAGDSPLGIAAEPGVLALGARARVLWLVQKILSETLRDANHRARYDLAKQLRSLHEIDFLFAVERTSAESPSP